MESRINLPMTLWTLLSALTIMNSTASARDAPSGASARRHNLNLQRVLPRVLG